MGDVIGDLVNTIKTTASNNAGSNTGIGSGVLIGIGFFVGLAILSVVGAFIWFHFSEKKKWNILTRVHYENPTIDGISMGSGVKTKRIRFKDGRVVYMFKTPIQGYTISPELLTWTRPREHDVIVTQDKKLFCLVGINSIDIQRKKLNVDVSYPDIEMDRQDLQQHIDSKKFDDPNEKFKIIAKVATYLFVVVGIIVLVVLGSKAYVDGKSIDAQRDQTNLEVTKMQLQVMEGVNTFVQLMNNNGIHLSLNTTGTYTS
jgi:hypothetical protein